MSAIMFVFNEKQNLLLTIRGGLMVQTLAHQICRIITTTN